MGNIGSAVLVCVSIAENLQNGGDAGCSPEKAPYHGNESVVILSDHDRDDDIVPALNIFVGKHSHVQNHLNWTTRLRRHTFLVE